MATLLSGLVSMAVVKDGYLPHKGRPFGQLHLCHAGPTAVFPGQGEGPQVWGARVCGVQIFVPRQVLWACFQIKSRAIKCGTAPALFSPRGPSGRHPCL